MKAFIVTLICIATLLLSLLLLPDTLTAADYSLKTMPGQLYNWMCENWAYFALAASEVAAFLPAKAKGIVQGVINVGSVIFKKKSKTPSKRL